MINDSLGRLFGSPARVKIMRLFILNKDTLFQPAEVIKRAKISKSVIRKELNLLKSAGFIKQKTKGWYLNVNFSQLELWKMIIVGTEVMKREDIASRFKGVGKIKFLAVSGVFIGIPEARVDLVLVADGLRKDKIEAVLKGLEADIGKELTYAYFETKEFLYRLGMYDKLIFDILDFPHERIIESKDLIDSTDLSTAPSKKA